MSKSLLTTIIAALVITAACGNSPSYRIEGTWEGGDGRLVYVIDGPENDGPVADSIVVENGRFEITSLELGRIVTLYAGADGYKKQVIFTAEPAIVTVAEGKNDRYETIVEQTPEQKLLEDAISQNFMSNLMSLGRMMAMSEVRDDPAKLDSVYRSFEDIGAEMDKLLLAKLDSAVNLMASAYAIEILILPNKPIAQGVELYDNLAPEVRQSAAGRRLKERIDQLLDVNVGGMAPEIDLTTPGGQNVKLSSLRGKYVLLDFWASWCGPCLREVPNVKAIYEDYKDKGFEIYGVSLDEPDQRDAWIAAIDKNGMDWIQVSSLKGWECPAARRYAVTGIPKMFLIDPEGRIIAMDLRGEALREKVASLFE